MAKDREAHKKKGSPSDPNSIETQITCVSIIAKGENTMTCAWVPGLAGTAHNDVMPKGFFGGSKENKRASTRKLEANKFVAYP